MVIIHLYYSVLRGRNDNRVPIINKQTLMLFKLEEKEGSR